MKMNKYMLLAATALTLVFAGCKSQDPFDSQTENDYPRILYPMSMSGELNTVLENPDAVWIDSVIVSPSAYTTVNWYLDGALVHTGLKIEKSFLSGKYRLLIEAVTTKGLRTERFGSLTVNPHSDAPYSEANGLERHVAAGMATYLEGVNLDKVTAIRLYTGYHAEVAAELTSFTATAGRIDFTVPELDAATYHVVLVDAEGKEYGANKLIVHDEPVITSGFDRFVVGKDWKLEGMNLNEVSSITVGTTTITEFTATADAITLTAPEMEEGEYTLTIEANGKQATFINKNGEMSNEVTVACIAKAIILICEEVYVGCNGDPDWTPKRIDNDFDWSKVSVGTVIYVEAHRDAATTDYNNFQIMTPDWGFRYPDADHNLEFDGENAKVFEITITAEMLAAFMEKGMGAAGHGTVIDRIYYEAPDETVIWEGEVVINWGDVNVSLPKEVTSGIREGAEILVYYEIVEADYHAFRLSTTWWGDDPATCDIVPQVDEFHTQPNPYVFEYDARAKSVADERGEWMFVGFGYKLLKVAVK